MFRRQNSGKKDSTTFYVFGRLPSGGTASIDILDVHNSDAVVPLTSNACSQVGGNLNNQSGTWKYDLSNVTTFPTTGERQWYYTMRHSTGVKDDGVINVGGYQDYIDYSLVSLSGDFIVVSGMVHQTSGNVVIINTNVDATVSSRLASAGYTAPDNTRIEFISGATHRSSGNTDLVYIDTQAIVTDTDFISGITHQTSGNVLTISADVLTNSGNVITLVGDTNVIRQFMSGDYVININTTPWQEEIYESGTDTKLFQRKLYQADASFTNVTATSHIIGRRSGS